MPIYEYVCRQCGHQFEWLTRADEDPACPQCGVTKLARQFSAPAAHTARSEPSCPAQPTCGMENCCGQRCFLNQ